MRPNQNALRAVVLILGLLHAWFVVAHSGDPSLCDASLPLSTTCSSPPLQHQEGAEERHSSTRDKKNSKENHNHQDESTIMSSQGASNNLDSMSIGDIKKELKDRFGIHDTSDCLEKSELVERLSTMRDAPIERGCFDTYGEVLTIGNKQKPTALVTLSHGLGDTARGWEDVGHELASQHPHVLFVLPTAPTQPVTINMGTPMPAWYDIKSLGNVNAAQDPNILVTSNYVTTLAYNYAARYRIDRKRIIFGGFSQGGALSLASGLLSSVRPAGILVMSGYLAAREHVLPKIRNTDVPILMCHGTQDNVLPLAFAEMSKKALEAAGVANIHYETFPMAHSVHPRELKLVSDFIKKYLP